MNALQRKVALVATMYEMLEFTEHERIGTRIRLKDSPEPPQVIGTRASFYPDLFAKAPTGKKRMVLVETVNQEDLRDPEKLKSKLQLFYTASEAYGWTFYLACFSGVADDLKLFCNRHRIRYSKLWTI